MTTELSKEKIEELQQKPWYDVYCIEGYTMTQVQQDAMYKEVYQPIVDWEKELAGKNKEIMKQVKNEVSGSLYWGICRYMKDLKENCYQVGQMEYKIVDKPRGDLQKEKWSKELQELWIDQWSEGCSGDSYAGNVYIKVGKNKYLTVNYSM